MSDTKSFRDSLTRAYQAPLISHWRVLTSKLPEKEEAEHRDSKSFCQSSSNLASAFHNTRKGINKERNSYGQVNLAKLFNNCPIVTPNLCCAFETSLSKS